MPKKKQIEVVAAVIEFDGQILCVQRGENKYDYISCKWEFPGGKIECGETKDKALAREIQEELHVKIQVKDKLVTVNHQYPDFFLCMHAYRCTVDSPTVYLTEHIAFDWVGLSHLQDFDWAAADLPIVEKLTNGSV
jgi:8-oxo-dGTP diphosphatase